MIQNLEIQIKQYLREEYKLDKQYESGYIIQERYCLEKYNIFLKIKTIYELDKKKTTISESQLNMFLK